MKYCAVVFILLTVLISPGYAQDTVHVKLGWNIIGSLKAGAVPDVLSTIPDSIISTSFFGYAPGVGYESTDTLGKGLGYWVKVSADGVIIFNTSVSFDCEFMNVSYEGIVYHTVQIGGQCWLEENLNVGTMVAGVTNQTDNAVLEKYCYGDNPVNCGVYGGFYQWDEAMQYVTTEGVQGICPPGWHIPTYAEYLTLSSTVGGDGNALKAIGMGTGAGAGTNASRFSALLAGFVSGGFAYIDTLADHWSSTNAGPYARHLELKTDTSTIGLHLNDKVYGYGVRCLED